MSIGAGQVKFSEINTELGRGSTAQISIHSAETGGYVALNPCGKSGGLPDGLNPNTVSEWHSYNHSVTSYTVYNAILQVCADPNCVDGGGGEVQVSTNTPMNNGDYVANGSSAAVVYRFTSGAYIACSPPSFTFTNATAQSSTFCCN